MFRSDAKLNVVKKCWHRGLPAQLHIHWLLSYMYMFIISVIYSTTIAMYKQPILPTHVNGHWSTFLVEEKKKEMIPFNWLDTKPQSYWATYLQNRCDDWIRNHKAIGLPTYKTAVTGSGAPAQIAISHLLRNKLIQ